MTRWISACLMMALIAAVAFAAACSKSASDQDAIRASIEKHLTSRADLNLSAMDREVKQITVDGDKATAQVEFRLKQGGGNMQVDYALARQGGEWTVLVSQPGGGQVSHPSMNQPPPNFAPSGAPGELPSFDNLLKNGPSNSGKSLPAGHPTVN
jgi:hypothetical protein